MGKTLTKQKKVTPYKGYTTVSQIMGVNLTKKVQKQTLNNNLTVNPKNTSYTTHKVKKPIINIKGKMYQILKKNGLTPNTPTDPLKGVTLTPTQHQNLVLWVKNTVYSTVYGKMYYTDPIYQPITHYKKYFYVYMVNNYINKKIHIKG